MIERHWTGVLHVHEADHYLAHLRDELFPAMRLLEGFVSASAATRAVDDGVEFRVVTTWLSLDAIAGFAGEDISRAVIAERAKAMMVRYDDRAAHYEVKLRM